MPWPTSVLAVARAELPKEENPPKNESNGSDDERAHDRRVSTGVGHDEPSRANEREFTLATLTTVCDTSGMKNCAIRTGFVSVVGLAILTLTSLGNSAMAQYPITPVPSVEVPSALLPGVLQKTEPPVEPSILKAVSAAGATLASAPPAPAPSAQVLSESITAASPAFTGSNASVPLAIAGGALLISGGAFLLLGRRRPAKNLG